MDNVNQTPPQMPQTQPSTSGSFGGMRDEEQNKLWAIMGYLWILFLVPMIAKKDSPFAQYHAHQGMILFVVWLVWWIGGIIVSAIFSSIPLLGPLLGALYWPLGGIGLFVLWIMGIINAAKGESKPLPFVGGLF